MIWNEEFNKIYIYLQLVWLFFYRKNVFPSLFVCLSGHKMCTLKFFTIFFFSSACNSEIFWQLLYLQNMIIIFFFQRKTLNEAKSFKNAYQIFNIKPFLAIQNQNELLCVRSNQAYSADPVIDPILMEIKAIWRVFLLNQNKTKQIKTFHE